MKQRIRRKKNKALDKIFYNKLTVIANLNVENKRQTFVVK